MTPLSQHRRQNSQAPGGGQVENDLAVGGLFSHKALRLRTRAYSLICKGHFQLQRFPRMTFPGLTEASRNLPGCLPDSKGEQASFLPFQGQPGDGYNDSAAQIFKENRRG